MDNEIDAFVGSDRQKLLADCHRLIFTFIHLSYIENTLYLLSSRFFSLKLYVSKCARVKHSAWKCEEPFTKLTNVRRARTGESTCRRSSATSKDWTHSPKVFGRIMFSSYVSSKCNQIAPGLKMNRKSPITWSVWVQSVIFLFYPFREEQEQKIRYIYDTWTHLRLILTEG